MFRYISIVTLASMAVQASSSQYYPMAIRDNLGLTYPTAVSRRLGRPQWFQIALRRILLAIKERDKVASDSPLQCSFFLLFSSFI
jgi:hypothetical protein